MRTRSELSHHLSLRLAGENSTRGLWTALAVALLFGSIATTSMAADKKDGKAEAAATAAEVAPEVILETDVYYKWQPVSADGSGTAEPLSVFYTKVTATGRTEEEAKSRLKTNLPEIQSEASSQCKLEHQSKASCIKSRYNKLSGDFSKLDFAIRHQVIANIEADCENIRGKCLGVATTEIIAAPKLIIVKTPGGGAEPNLTAVAPEKTATAPVRPATPEPTGPKPQEPDTPVPFGFQ